jgi:glyoxylase-like metal-dependent hydrolase (beta-lactamase superfamily II)
MKILELSDELYLVDLPHNREGFRKFISSWVFRSDGNAFVVDVGTTTSVKKLIEALEYLKVRRIEYILLTHIHIDHAGGVGEFLKYHPEAKVVVHPSGVKHLINPEKLWKGTLKVLGDLALIYGEIKPVPEDNIYSGDLEFQGSEIEIIETPGHAPHHQSYVFDKYLFAGEAIGVHQYLKIKDYYVRPATPPKFIYDIAVSSIRTLENLGNLTVCYGHFGYEENCNKMAENYRNQLDLWVDVVREVACQKDYSDEKSILEIVRSELFSSDPVFAKYGYLEEDIKKREDYFIDNTLRGILGYVKETFCPD